MAYMRRVHNIDFHRTNSTLNIALIVNAQTHTMEKQGLINNLNDLVDARKGIQYID